MIIDDDSEDSSVQILVPPSHEIIDLDSNEDVVDSPSFAPKPVSHPFEEPLTLTFASLPEVTQIPSATILVTTLTSAYVPPVEREDGPVVTDLLRHFHPTLLETTELTPSMPIADKYRFGMPVLAVSEPVIDQQPILGRTETQTSAVVIIPDPLVTSASETPVCDTAPSPAPIPVTSLVVSSLRSIVETPPVSSGTLGMYGDTVPTSAYTDLLHHYWWVCSRYEEAFYARDSLLRMISDPVRIATSVLTGLQTGLAALPSTSSGQLDRDVVTVLVGQASSEYHMRVNDCLVHIE
ncbi:hypothetical protein POM88_041244 [Heracleum sosnowskyi]|uniref:Uncharacterized protein n=1 Tax=Heracleum sosnowskyi TaxID=360622 RepID=A0AAD8HG99_9APIA|nr:hypothetical protein POM88_041244 [Heracleum sosnowskyi]